MKKQNAQNQNAVQTQNQPAQVNNTLKPENIKFLKNMNAFTSAAILK